MQEPNNSVTNWEGNVVTHPRLIVRPQSVDELKAIVRKKDVYPSPVRAMGSNYSSTRCTVCDDGTLIDMRGMDKILHVGSDSIKVQAGALMIDVARELRGHDLQLYVGPEMGNMTMGSAACGGTRNASMPGQYGQLSSYVSEMKVVTPTGGILEITESRPDLLRLMRSSYGLLGIVCEVTFKVTPLRAVNLRYESFNVDAFCEVLPRLLSRQEAMKLYLFPFRDAVTVEFRRPLQDSEASNAMLWKLWNWSNRTALPVAGNVTTAIPIKPVRYYCMDGLGRVVQAGMTRVLSGTRIVPTNQIKRFPRRSGIRRMSYSPWAFPEAGYPWVLRDYVDFCLDYYRDNGYRCDMINLGHRISQDDSSLFSYSFNGPVLTIEPVSTGGPEWEDFLVEFNDFCSSRGGAPLFNQTRSITHKQALRAFGERLRSFVELRQRLDPNNRFLNAYFMQILG